MVAQSVIRADDWRPRGPGFESCWRHFAIKLSVPSMPGEVKYHTQGLNV